MTLADQLYRTIAATVPIVSVSIGDPADKRTWTVDPKALQAQAQPIIDAFNPTDPATISAGKDLDAAVIDADLMIRAVAQLDFEERQKLVVINGQTLRTAAQCFARVKAIYRGLL